MKQNIGPIAIIIAVLALIGVGVLIYSMTNQSPTAGYKAPPGDADAKAAAQKQSEDYGKRMAEQMKNQHQGGGQRPR
jgi:hypothetical protein